MAGSYKHVIDEEGKLLNSKDMHTMIENFGDVFETIEEMYGMIWFLAKVLREHENKPKNNFWAVEDMVTQAQLNYKRGLKYSPGTNGQLPEGNDE